MSAAPQAPCHTPDTLSLARDSFSCIFQPPQRKPWGPAAAATTKCLRLYTLTLLVSPNSAPSKASQLVGAVRLPSSFKDGVGRSPLGERLETASSAQLNSIAKTHRDTRCPQRVHSPEGTSLPRGAVHSQQPLRRFGAACTLSACMKRPHTLTAPPACLATTAHLQLLARGRKQTPKTELEAAQQGLLFPWKTSASKLQCMQACMRRCRTRSTNGCSRHHRGHKGANRCRLSLPGAPPLL